MRKTMIKKWNKIIIVALIVMLCINGMNLWSLRSSATEDTYINGFNLTTYKADIYLRDDTVCNNIIQNMLTGTLPSQVVVDYLNTETSFQSEVSAWKLAHYAKSPSEIVDGAIDEKGYYEAMILSVFISEATNENYVFDLGKKVTADTNTILSNAKKWVEESDKLELEQLSKNQSMQTISDGDKKEIETYLKGEFEKIHPALAKSASFSDALNTFLESVNTIGEAIELMSYYTCVCDLSIEIKTVLLDMYEKCPESNVALKSALYEVVFSMDDFNSGIDAALLNVTEKEVANVVGTFLDEGWKSVLKANPYVAAFSFGADIGISFSTMVSNNLFSTDKTIEQYEKMRCMGEFVNLIRVVVEDTGEKYLSNSTTENANKYFAAVDALFSASKLSCDYAYAYAEILYDTPVGWMAISNADYDKYTSSVTSIKEYYEEFQESLIVNYLAELEYEYPEIYKTLYGQDETENVSVTGIAFPNEEMSIGINDIYFCHVEEPIIYPENATNQNVKYSSSDNSICSVVENTGYLSLNKSGTVTITVTTVDGGFSDTIQVTVTEENGEIMNNIGVLANGKCGDDVYWSLYGDGSLVIRGTGEMDDYWLYTPSATPWDNYSSEIRNVEIEDGITSIGNYAFSDCSSLSSISISDGVTSIGRGAFDGCSSLSCISIPDGVTSIEDSAFFGCSSLSCIIIPDGITSIEDGVFWNCSSLSDITIPDGVTSIGDNAFWGCSSLSSIRIPDGVTSIGNYAFSNCRSLSSIRIPDGVTYIGDYTFSGCSSLSNIAIPNGVTSIKSGTFYGCNSLSSIIIPEGVTSIGYAAFYCSSLSSIRIPDGVTYIGDHTFCGCSSLSNIAIPDGVTYIGDYTFSGCSSLSNIAIPDGVTSIGSDAFSGCNNLSIITIPAGVTSIGSGAFSGCSSLSSITIPNGVTSIEGAVFKDCCSLSNIDIPAGVTSIGSDAFSGCNNLSIITIPAGVTSIGSGAFSGCSSLSSITIPDGVTSIEDDVFKDCSSLSNLAIPDGVTSIGHGAFYGCSSLSNIIIPAGVTSIGNLVFAFCSSLSDITIPNGVNCIGNYAFIGCNSLSDIIIPSSVENIGMNAFNGCSNLTTITIPNGVTSIESGTFYGCNSLSSITIPRGVTSIGYGAFWECNRLKNVIIYSTNIEINREAFENSWITLMSYSGSTVETYAKTYNISFIPLSGVEIDDLRTQLENTEYYANVTTTLKSTTILTATVLDILKEKNITLNLALDDTVTWGINGADISSDELSNIDLSVTKTAKDAGNISANTITALAGSRIAEQLIFAHEGSLGMVGELSLKMSDSISEEKGVLLQISGSNGSLEFADSALILNNTITFDVDQGTDSVIVYGTNGDINGDGTVVSDE